MFIPSPPHACDLPCDPCYYRVALMKPGNRVIQILQPTCTGGESHSNISNLHSTSCHRYFSITLHPDRSLHIVYMILSMIAQYLQSGDPYPSHRRLRFGVYTVTRILNMSTILLMWQYCIAKLLDTAEECVAMQYSAEKSVMSRALTRAHKH